MAQIWPNSVFIETPRAARSRNEYVGDRHGSCGLARADILPRGAADGVCCDQNEAKRAILACFECVSVPGEARPGKVSLLTIPSTH